MWAHCLLLLGSVLQSGNSKTSSPVQTPLSIGVVLCSEDVQRHLMPCTPSFSDASLLFVSENHCSAFLLGFVLRNRGSPSSRGTITH